MDLNTHMYALFLGLYLMGREIPSDVADYVSNYTCKTPDKDLFFVFQNMIGADDLRSDIVKDMVLKGLR